MTATTWTLMEGDCRARLRELPAESIHCVVTSPPYWGLRDYGIPPSVWGGDPACAHGWGEESRLRSGAQQDNGPGGGVWNAETRGQQPASRRTEFEISTGASCARCGAWLGILGLEPTPALYVEHMIEIMREIRRVLRKDGTLWLNLGDCYATGAGKVGDSPGGGEQGARWRGEIERVRDPMREYRRFATNTIDPKARGGIGPMTQPNRMPLAGLKPKDLVGMPWRVAFALQADGWWLRSDIIWAKPNPMPESVTDRPTKAHEYIFLLTRSDRYFYDAIAARELAQYGRSDHHGANIWRSCGNRQKAPVRQTGTQTPGDGGSRNLRTVWRMTTQPFADAHFATFPVKLPARCIKAGTSQRGVCARCGAPWERQVSVEGAGTTGVAALGWRATCTCSCEEPVPATVLDPFSGAGTTGVAALGLGRSYIGCELNPKYNDMARKRLGGHLPLFSQEKAVAPAVETLPLFDESATLPLDPAMPDP